MKTSSTHAPRANRTFSITPKARAERRKTVERTLRKVTLTFDNGPEPGVTPQVLDCLKRHDVKATFFVIGRKLATPSGQELAQRASQEGHWIGNHTYSHRTPLGLLDAAEAIREIERVEELLGWLKQPVRLFRPYAGAGTLGPHILQPAAIEKLQRERYTCVIWNSVPGDWRDPHDWLDRALSDSRMRPWSLVVLHDLPTGAMDHLDDFIRRLRDDGVELTQAFPVECTPMVDGRINTSMAAYSRVSA
jgi:peptidoglycan/xylan/chitin deacetylase (PgdA/CDA1 family)